MMWVWLAIGALAVAVIRLYIDNRLQARLNAELTDLLNDTLNIALKKQKPYSISINGTDIQVYHDERA